MKIAIAVFIGLALVPAHAQAAFTGFEELETGSIFAAGSTFDSDGLRFRSVTFREPPGGINGVRVDQQDTPHDVLNDKHLIFGLERGIEFQLSQHAAEISFSYIIGSPSSRMIINGTEVIVQTLEGFSSLDGTVVAGVQIGTQHMGHPLVEGGTVTLRGPISSFTVGGTEVWIDNVQVVVPEPATGALAVLSGVWMLLMARRRSSVPLL
jgi:hypothetical protein